MLRIAVTGGIACGKSVVGSLLQAEGIPVCDADELAHIAMEPGSSAYEKVVEAFGREILGDDERIDRPVLGKQVFSDPNKLERLNGIVHPPVRKLWDRWLKEQNASAAVVIIPLFFEIEEQRDNWDAVISVASSRDDQLQRLGDRGLSDSEAESRIAAQATLQEKMTKSDYVIFNGGSVDALKEQTLRVLRALLER